MSKRRAMRAGPWAGWNGLALVLLISLPSSWIGCAGGIDMPPSAAIPPAPPDSTGKSIRIVSYTTADSVRHEVTASVTAVGPDSLSFIWYETSLEFGGGEWPEPPEHPFVLARADVLSLEKRCVSPTVRDVGVLALIVAAGLAIGAMIGAADDAP